jgi:hypothetical protein
MGIFLSFHGVPYIGSQGMLEKGFEWSLEKGEPLNLPPKRYLWQIPCCKIQLNVDGVLACAHSWKPIAEFPKGDPQTGGAWNRSYPDPGTYVGGHIDSG